MRVLFPVLLLSACKPSIQFPNTGCGQSRTVDGTMDSPFSEPIATTALGVLGSQANIDWVSPSNPLPPSWSVELGPAPELYTIDDYLTNCAVNAGLSEHRLRGTATLSSGNTIIPVSFYIEWFPGSEPFVTMTGTFNHESTEQWITELLADEPYDVPDGGYVLFAAQDGVAKLGVPLAPADANDNQGMPDEAQGTITVIP